MNTSYNENGLRSGKGSEVGLFSLCFFLLTLTFLRGLPASAQSPWVVVATDSLTVEDVVHPEASQLFDLATRGEIAAVNTAERQAREFTAETLSGLPLHEIVIGDGGTGILTALQEAQHHPSPLTLFRLQFEPDNRARSLRRLNILLYSLRSTTPNPNLVVLSSQSRENGKRLGVVIAAGESFLPGLLVSASTRTPGLVTNIDLRALLYFRFGVVDPLNVGGRVPHSTVANLAKTDDEARLAEVRRLVYVAERNDLALHSAMPLIFGGIAALVIGSLWHRRLRFGILLALNLPLALLFAPLFPPPTLWEYALRILAMTTGLSVLIGVVGKRFRLSAPLLCGGLLALTVSLDLSRGQPLLKASLLSGYPLSGIRFYGIGNEYLGVICGFLLLGFLLSETVSPLLVAGSVGLALLFGLPGFGANAGSLIISTVGIGTAILVGKKRRVTLKHGFLLAIAGFLLAFLFSALEARLLKSEASHLGAALQTAGNGGGVATLFLIALRKVGMNLRLLLSPWFLLFGGSMAIVIRFTLHHLEAQIAAWLDTHPQMKLRFPVVVATALATLLFKDSGVIAVSFLLGTVLLGLLWQIAEIRAD